MFFFWTRRYCILSLLSNVQVLIGDQLCAAVNMLQVTTIPSCKEGKTSLLTELSVTPQYSYCLLSLLRKKKEKKSLRLELWFHRWVSNRKSIFEWSCKLKGESFWCVLLWILLTPEWCSGKSKKLRQNLPSPWELASPEGGYPIRTWGHFKLHLLLAGLAIFFSVC